MEEKEEAGEIGKTGGSQQSAVLSPQPAVRSRQSTNPAIAEASSRQFAAGSLQEQLEEDGEAEEMEEGEEDGEEEGSR